MKRFLTACACGLLMLVATSSQAQTVRQTKLYVDDGTGKLLVITAPAGMTGTGLTWTMPLPPVGNPPSGFMNTGTVTGQLPWWDNSGTGQWTKSTNLNWDNTNSRLAIGATSTTFNLDVTGTSNVSSNATFGGNLLLTDAAHSIAFTGAAAAAGNALAITGQSGAASSNGGSVTITGGTAGATAGNGGAVTISGGATTTGLLGDVNINGHNISIQDAVPTSGAVTINTNPGTGTTTIGNGVKDVAISAANWSIPITGIANFKGITTTGVLNATGATVAGASPLVFEGSTVDANTTTLAVMNPTALNTITLPNASGTVVLSTGSFTQGSVVFAGASGVFAEDNTKFFWDNSTKRLGLGTATPGATLDVTGTASVSSTLTASGNVVLSGDVQGAGSNRFAEQVTITGTGAQTYAIANTHVTATSVIVYAIAKSSTGAYLTTWIESQGVGTFSVHFSSPISSTGPETVVVNYMVIN